MSPEWLFDEHGRLIPDVLVLSHEEQRSRLRRDCPAAAAVSMVAGDPCLDRMAASTPLRAEYRHAFGVETGQRLVLLSSTWGPRSLFAGGMALMRRFTALALDDYQVVLALHPNVRAWHSPWQVERWLLECAQAGVTVLPSPDGWGAALVAADAVVGDHGSVTFYGAVLGRPVLLASAPLDAVAPDSAIGRFLRAAPRLDDHRDVTEQIEGAIAAYSADRFAPITALATSAPGESAALLRQRLYQLMRLAEPAWPAEVRAMEIPHAAQRAVGAQLVRAELMDDKSVLITRYPVSALDPAEGLPTGTHLVTHSEQPVRRHLELAEIVVVSRSAVAVEVLRGLPGCALATARESDGTWVVITPGGDRVRADGLLGTAGRLAASVVHAWLAAGRPLDELPSRMGVQRGSQCSEVVFQVESGG